MAPSAASIDTTSTTTHFLDRQDGGQGVTAKPSRDVKGVINRGMPPGEIAAREPDDRTKWIDAPGGRRKQTVLEQHVSFFDINSDGVLYPHETYLTCRRFSWSMPLCLFFAIFLHLVQSWGTVPWWHGLPDPFLRIWVHNVHFNKHGSSTMAFDNDGVFRPERLDEWFEKFDMEGKGGLRFWEGFRAVRRIRMAWDIFGQASALFEWSFVYILLWPDDGIVRREDAHRVLDGSIFHEKVMDNQRRERKKQRDKVNGVKTR